MVRISLIYEVNRLSDLKSQRRAHGSAMYTLQPVGKQGILYRIDEAPMKQTSIHYTGLKIQILSTILGMEQLLLYNTEHNKSLTLTQTLIVK